MLLIVVVDIHIFPNVEINVSWGYLSVEKEWGLLDTIYLVDFMCLLMSILAYSLFCLLLFIFLFFIFFNKFKYK